MAVRQVVAACKPKTYNRNPSNAADNSRLNEQAAEKPKPNHSIKAQIKEWVAACAAADALSVDGILLPVPVSMLDGSADVPAYMADGIPTEFGPCEVQWDAVETPAEGRWTIPVTTFNNAQYVIDPEALFKWHHPKRGETPPGEVEFVGSLMARSSNHPSSNGIKGRVKEAAARVKTASQAAGKALMKLLKLDGKKEKGFTPEVPEFSGPSKGFKVPKGWPEDPATITPLHYFEVCQCPAW